MNGIDIFVYPLHLGLGATAASEPEFTGEMSWYDAYLERHRADGLEGRLVGDRRRVEGLALSEARGHRRVEGS